MTNPALESTQPTPAPTQSVKSPRNLTRFFLLLIIPILITISAILGYSLYKNTGKKQTATLYDNQNNPQGQAIYFQHSNDEFNVIYANLPSLTNNQAYQAWYMDPNNNHLKIDKLSPLKTSSYNYATASHYHPSLHLNPSSTTENYKNYTIIIITQESNPNDNQPETIVLQGELN